MTLTCKALFQVFLNFNNENYFANLYRDCTNFYYRELIVYGGRGTSDLLASPAGQARVSVTLR